MSDDNWREKVLETTGIFNDGQTDLPTMRRLVLENMPDCLYRYRSGHNGDMDALREGYEWLSYPDGYNDPFDARIFYNHEEALTPVFNNKMNEMLIGDVRAQFKWLTGEEKLDVNGERGDLQLLNKAKIKQGLNFSSVEKKCLEMVGLWRELAQKMQESGEASIRRKSLICSFTTKHLNYLMWAHYANSHKGYCLEYKVTDFILDNGFVLPVTYRDSPVYVTNLIKKAVQGEKRCGASAAIGSALVKSAAWQYEDEWRYIYFGEKMVTKLNGLQLNRVILGCNASDELKHEVVEICRERGVGVVKQKRSPNSFEVVEGERLL